MTNRLQTETSPYLLQHADNPVHWQPWDEQALQQARELDKPILLSIGYSACHWCHVMAHESFADETTAAAMNEGFVNIKVDREERPDLDKVYQLAHQVLTQQTGGWPLTMFLDPHSLLPFFGGTYFPKIPRQQMPGFTDLLARVTDAWQEQRDQLGEQSEKLAEVFAQINATDVASSLGDDQALAEQACNALAGQYDSAEGGFGSAPKFPMASTLSFLLRYAITNANREAMDMVMTTLTRMARGGIYDHLGGGFFRYATDRLWAIPHFEKMLYDNGQLLSLYADAVAVGPDALFTGALRDSAAWLLRDMCDPEGGFYAARDADSEGEEGKYYVWRREEIKRALNEDEYLLIETLYGLDKPANFASRWNLTRRDAWRSVVMRLSLSPEVAAATLADAQAKLLQLREQRPAPGLDNKVLTAWNAMVIKGLAKTSVALDEPEWLLAAQRCTDFLREQLFDGETLYATWQGQARFPAYLDDYANLLDALTVLLSISWRECDAAFATTLADMALQRFSDQENGGFYFTDSGDELFHRPKPTMDDATPPGNGVMADALIRLGHLFAEPEYLDAAEATLRWADARMQQYPAGHCTLLSALSDCNHPPEQIIVRGPEDQLADWLAVARDGYQPQRVSYGIPYEGNRTVPSYLPKLVSIEEQSSVVAFHCENFTCSPPIRSLDALKAALKKG